MKRLMIFAALAMLAAISVGCNSTRQCRLFGNRGAQCDACTVPACCPQPTCCSQPTCCESCGGGGGSGYYGGYSEMAPSLQSGSCCGGAGAAMPQGGMIYGGQVVPGPSTGPMIMPTQPMPGPETSLQP